MIRACSECGVELTENNTYETSRKDLCKPCYRSYQREWRQQRKAESVENRDCGVCGTSLTPTNTSYRAVKEEDWRCKTCCRAKAQEKDETISERIERLGVTEALDGDTCNECGDLLTGENYAAWLFDSNGYLCRSCNRKKIKGWHEENPGKKSEYHAKSVQKLRRETYEAYGGECACCGEDQWQFLSIDHENGGGAEERERLGLGGVGFYRLLRQQGFPKEGYRLLCMNCNTALGFYGYCPHQKEESEKTPS